MQRRKEANVFIGIMVKLGETQWACWLVSRAKGVYGSLSLPTVWIAPGPLLDPTGAAQRSGHTRSIHESFTPVNG
jgi:hypothetical protein